MRGLQSILIFLAIACSSRGNDAERAKAASQAMSELDAADDTFPKQFTSELSGLSAGLMMGNPGSTAEQIKNKILPLMDSYLAVIDRAVTTADTSLADKNDEKTKQSLEKIRQRGDSFRKARARFGDLEEKARGGASVDQVSSSLMNIGMMLSVGMQGVG